MPAFTFTSPEGKQYTLEGPEGATSEQAFAILQQHLGGGQKSSARDGTISETIDAAVRGAANALTFGFADRLAAGAGAATGIGGKFGDYEANLSKQREIDKANLIEHPVASIGGAVAGGLALPVGAVAQAPTLAGRMAAGIGVGGAQGALYGVGSSPDLGDTSTVGRNALVGGATGAAIGGLAPPLIEGASLAGQGLLRATGIPQAIEGLRDPQGVASRMVADKILADRAQGAAGMTQQAFDEAASRGQPVLTGDLGGDATRRLARQASNMSAEAGNALKGATQERFQGQGPRVADLVQGLGGGNSVETLDKLKKAAKNVYDPLYKKAFAEGDKGIWTPELERLSGSPDVLSAMKSAVTTGKSRAITEGYGAFNPGVQITEDGRVLFQQGAKGVPTYPNLQYWDAVKRNLDDAASAALKAGKRDEGSRISSQAKMLRSELDNAVPSYADARGMAATAFGAEDALDAGAKFVSAKGQNQEYAKAIAKMSSPERKLFAHGFLAELENKIGEIGDNRDVTINAIFTSPKSRQRIEMAIGKDKAAEFEKYIHAESIMMRLKNAVSGNSTTAEQTADLATGLAGGFLSHGISARSAIDAVKAVNEHGVNAANAKVMRKVGELLASPNPPDQVRAMRIIGASPGVQAALKPFAPHIAAGAISYDAQKRKSAPQ